MKAYQLKIAEKNKKPPVWSRAILPAGITFSQLSILLTEIMGYQGTEIFEFEFFQKKVRLFEEQQIKASTSAFYYDRASAAETFINDLLDSEEWFSFYWGTGTSCRITIEKRLEEVPLTGIGVLTSKGLSADIDDVNDVLKKQYAVRYGEADFRSRADLLDGIDSGSFGLTGSLEAVSKTDNYKKSADHYMGEIARLMNIKHGLEQQLGAREAVIQELKDQELKAQELKAQELKEQNTRGQESKGSRGTLKHSLLAYTMLELKEYAGQLHLSKVSALNKDKLAEKIKNEILSIPVMKKRLSVLTDEQIEVFEEAIARGQVYRPQPDQLDLLMDVYNLDYVVIYDDDYVEVPVEVVRNYKQINTPEFHQLRKQIAWMQMCLEMHAMIYGIAPIDIVHRMYRKRKGFKVSLGEWLDIFYSIPDEENSCIIKDRKVILKSILRNNLYLGIERRQGDKEFYVPAYAEVADCIGNHYPSQEPVYQKLRAFFADTMGIKEEKVLLFLQRIWSQVSLGYRLSEIMDDLDEKGFCFDNEWQVELFVALMQEINNETRMLANRGFKPNELSAIQKGNRSETGIMPTIIPESSMAAKLLREAQPELDARGISVDYDSGTKEIATAVMPEGAGGVVEWAKRKIYPNDPCPCRSGKKYKKCCGRVQ